MSVRPDPGLCVREGCVNSGGNSGYQAVNLAYGLGAERIVLLGFDMQKTGGRSHWHGDHEGGLPNLGRLDHWAARFVALGADLRAAGVPVVNCTRQTAITCFPILDLELELADVKPLLIEGMQGLGDNIYQRPFVAELSKTRPVYVRTAWPELYADLPGVRAVRPQTTLRTQAKNVAHVSNWAEPPRGAEVVRVGYGAGLERSSIWEEMAKSFGVRPDAMTLPLGESALPDAYRYVVVRPVTERKEWRNPARNPYPEYVNQCAASLRADGYHLVVVADLQHGEEWLVGGMPDGADLVFANGQLSPLQLFGLVQGAAAVLGGVGWIVPAAIAARVPIFTVLGGQGGHNAPDRIVPPVADNSLLGWGTPDAYCGCSSMQHNCDKRNSNLAQQFREWRVRVQV